MAYSLLRLITSNLHKRSTLSYCFLSSIHTANMPTHDLFDRSWLRNLSPKISSISIKARMRDIYNQRPDMCLDVDDGDVKLEMPGIEELKIMQACDDHQHHTKANYLAGISLPADHDMKEGLMLKLPNDDFKNEIIANIILNVVSSFYDITAKHCWSYYDMFYDRSIIGEGFCPIIAMLSPMINSFAIYKKENEEYLTINIHMPAPVKMKLTRHGLRVSLNMRPQTSHYYATELERGSIKTYFEYDTFFIEGKTKNEHYITGIHLPQAGGIHMKHNMIKRKMKDNVFSAFLPFVKK